MTAWFLYPKVAVVQKSGVATTYPKAPAWGSWAGSPSWPFMRGLGIELSKTLAGAEGHAPIKRVQRDTLISTLKGARELFPEAEEVLGHAMEHRGT